MKQNVPIWGGIIYLLNMVFSTDLVYILFQTQIGTHPFHNDANLVYTEVCHYSTDTVLNMYLNRKV